MSEGNEKSLGVGSLYVMVGCKSLSQDHNVCHGHEFVTLGVALEGTLVHQRGRILIDLSRRGYRLGRSLVTGKGACTKSCVLRQLGRTCHLGLGG